MSEESRVQENREFIETCLKLELLRETDAESLRAAIRDTHGFIAQTAIQRGLLTPADVDIVHSLQNPTTVVPGYKILQLIGRGGMGVVYRAEQLDLERTVALKTILISSVHDPTVAARFEREAKALARLQHPNIVQALNFGKHEGRYYFAMEYVPGRTCEQDVRRRGVIPAIEVWSIVRQVASGLMHALAQNVLHRDIKPANLLLLPAPEGSASVSEIVKIADFGLAMFADQGPEQLKLTTGDKLMGSPAYMSLEQFGGREVDFRSDMYSLGATAWHLLFGKPPFQGSNLAALFHQKSERLVIDPATLPVVLPEDQMRLLMGLLDPDPDQRPKSYRQLIDAIDAVCLGRAVSPTAGQVESESNRVSISEQVTLENVRPSAVELESLSLGSDAIANGMSSTIDLEIAPRRPTRLRWVIAAAITVLIIAIISIPGFVGAKRGPRPFTRVVGDTPLFDGVTLSGWDVGGSMVGAWNTVEAPDASTAIACTTRQGGLTRRFPEVPNPRISLFVWLREIGGPVDIDFAFDPADPASVRGCLRLTSESVKLGEKRSDFGELAATVDSTALPTLRERYHVIDIERQPEDWYVFLEERLVGTLPIKHVGDGNAIRLVVHGGESAAVTVSQVFFADVQLSDLRLNEDAANKTKQ